MTEHGKGGAMAAELEDEIFAGTDYAALVPIDRIRAAERLMRERAKAASRWAPDRWFAANGAVYGGTAAPHQIIAPGTTYDGDSEHIASWHPAVALDVADLLRQAAMDLWAHGPLCCADGCGACDDSLWMPYARRALRVADTFLGITRSSEQGPAGTK